MSTARISHKHQKPTLPSTTLHREEIIQALADAIEPRDSAMSSPHKLVLLCASAGYGKTTLLVDTVNRLSSTCCCYISEDPDAAPALFLQRLHARIPYCLPAVGRQLTTQLE